MEQHSQFDLGLKESETKETVLSTDLVSPNTYRTDKNFLVKNFYEMNDTEFRNSVGQKFARISFSGSIYSCASSDYLIGITSLALAPTIGLPRPSLMGVGKTFIVKDEAGGAATTTITVQSVGEENIDGAATSTLTTNYQAKTFYTDGANWFTI